MSTMSEDDGFVYRWRGNFENDEACARGEDQLVGFVNVAWDGNAHAFALDTTVAGFARRAGIGSKLVAVATQQACTAGCEWLHVASRNPCAASTSRPAALSVRS